MGLPYKSHHEEEINKNIPMLFLLGEFSGESNHAWLNPKNHTSKFWQLEDQMRCLTSGFGWLLIQSRNTSSFFNPFTRQRINLPYHDSVITAVAFSASPTSPDCTVFTYRLPSVFGVRIDTLLVGQETWTRHAFMRDPSFFGSLIQAMLLLCASIWKSRPSQIVFLKSLSALSLLPFSVSTKKLYDRRHYRS
ncbi:hypothetical protein L3X38_037940 [Prunus dulcis]|uniref:KIB1-4 beta-propeller domain-containing protein n=1 Tax=Prunus dulcis TaxID=3755 RepID=A0AAD4YQ12_PRUDU|nr:hypothetical protein L3X38_037940 [Prunus dulcis]